MEMESPAVVEVFVSYQVYCASWRPAYDVRAVTSVDGEQGNSIKLCYYGLVEQNTGDDWGDTDMVLSTSSPSIGDALRSWPLSPPAYIDPTDTIVNDMFPQLVGSQCTLLLKKTWALGRSTATR